MAKKNLLKIAKSSLRRLVLEMSVTHEGKKVSDRTLWSNPIFMEKTGLYQVNEYTKERQMISLGSVSYWKKILKLSAEEVFEYHQMVSQLIEPLTLFSEWNLRSATKSIGNGVLSEKSKKSKLIKDFKLSDGAYYNTYTLLELERSIIELFDMMGEDGKKILKEYYKKG